MGGGLLELNLLDTPRIDDRIVAPIAGLVPPVPACRLLLGIDLAKERPDIVGVCAQEGGREMEVRAGAQCE